MKQSLAANFEGLHLAPSQVYGAVRIVPVLREPIADLRFALRGYDEELAEISVGKRTSYFGYIPHALIVSRATGGQPAAAPATRLFRKDGRVLTRGPVSVRLAARMARREDRRRLRLLPLHLAMEGFLAQSFGGPELVSEVYSSRALSRGLSPRLERSVPGRFLPGLQDALRVFEIHEGQCGALVYVADAFASAFVVSHPDDYRLLHRSLVEDFFGALIMLYASSYARVGELQLQLEADQATSFADLRAALSRLRAEQSQLQAGLTDELFRRSLRGERVYRLGPFELWRFLTDLQPSRPNHLGECILRKDGSVAYLKTYRLSAAQVRRAYLLQQLSAAGWDFEATAKALRQRPEELMLRLEKAGFGFLLREDVLARARKWARQR